MQREAAEQAEENWESLKAAEKRIFEDIAKGAPAPLPLCISKPQVTALLPSAMNMDLAKGVPPSLPLCASFLHPLDCCFSTSRHKLQQV